MDELSVPNYLMNKLSFFLCVLSEFQAKATSDYKPLVCCLHVHSLVARCCVNVGIFVALLFLTHTLVGSFWSKTSGQTGCVFELRIQPW